MKKTHQGSGDVIMALSSWQWDSGKVGETVGNVTDSGEGREA